MKIQNITVEDLRRMEDKEGLVLQGCGGDPGEWVQGINDLLAQEGILLEGTAFTHVSVFQNEGLTCLLFPFEDVKLDIGKLAMWRLQTHDTFGGTWLSDYIDNRLGHEPAQETPGKPDCPLIGQDGNIFNLVGIASRTLKAHGMPEQAKEMADRVFSCDSYHKALCIIGEYVNITSADREAGRPHSIRQQLKNNKAPETAAPKRRQRSRNDKEDVKWNRYMEFGR